MDYNSAISRHAIQILNGVCQCSSGLICAACILEFDLPVSGLVLSAFDGIKYSGNTPLFAFVGAIVSCKELLDGGASGETQRFNAQVRSFAIYVVLSRRVTVPKLTKPQTGRQ